MADLNGQEAAHRLLAFGRYATGMCLEAVFKAFGSPSSDKPAGSYGKARNVWENTPEEHRHRGDRNVPAGAIALFSNTKYPERAGHITIGLGGESLASTDKPGIGQTGVTSISAIENSWGGRTYLGWVDRFLGHKIVGLGGTAPAATPAAPGGSLRRGSKGEDVRRLQSFLKRNYPAYAGKIAVDGDFGAQTEGAVKEFQRRSRIKVDGIVGAQSRAAGLRY